MAPKIKELHNLAGDKRKYTLTEHVNDPMDEDPQCASCFLA